MKYILFLLFTFSLHAKSLDECFKEGEILGDGRSPNDVSLSCFNIIKQKAVVEASYSSSLYEAHGHGNILFYKRDIDGVFTPGKISGESSLLETISAIDVDEENNTIIVLANTPRKIMTYTLKYNGNIAPWYIVDTDEVKEATNIKALSKDNELAVLVKSQGKILIYEREASSKGAREQNTLVIKRSISSVNSPQSLFATETHYYVLDNEAKQVFKMNKDGSSSELIIEDEKLKDAIEIQSVSNEKLSFTLSTGLSIELSI